MGTGAGTRAEEAATAVELWSRRVADSSGQIAFRHKPAGGMWQAVTWAEADAAAREIAAGLCAAGMAAGDRVCIASQTCLDWMLCDVGILLGGGVPVPIYPSSTAEQCAFIIRDAGAELVIVDDAAQLERILAVRADLPAVRRVIFFGGDAVPDKPDARGRKLIRMDEVRPPFDAAVQSLGELCKAGRARRTDDPAELDRRSGALRADSTFTIIYTSGTTGNPKGVVLTHGNVTAALASACRTLTLLPVDEQLLFLPLAHVLARELAWVTVQAGIVTWFAESIAKLKDNLREARPTFMGAVPRVFEKFHAAVQIGLGQGSPTKKKLVAWALDTSKRLAAEKAAGRQPALGLKAEALAADLLVFSKLRRKMGLGRCRFLISGGAPLAAEIGEFFARAGLLILEGYGLTETVAAAFLNRLDRYRFGTVGPALDVVESKIAGDGEILMRGPSVFRRYHNNAQATAEAIDAEGWFHSGDIGEIEDGFLRITDRKKDLIVTAGGKKIAPQAIENALKIRTPLVAQVVVFGDRRPYCVALVTPSDEALKRFGGGGGADSGGALDTAALQAALEGEVAAMNAGLAAYESIKAFAVLPVDFTEAAGEMTPSMKVKRKVVIEKHRALIDGLYGGPGGTGD